MRDESVNQCMYGWMYDDLLYLCGRLVKTNLTFQGVYGHKTCFSQKMCMLKRKRPHVITTQTDKS